MADKFPSMTPQFESFYVKPKPGRVLIVGSYITEGKPDRRKLHADAIGFDMRPGPGVDHVVNLEQMEDTEWQCDRFAHVECLSTLEHSKRPWLMAANIEKLMEPMGTIFISVPFVWAYHGHPDDYWRMTPEAISILFANIDWIKLTYSTMTLDANVRKQRHVDSRGYNYFPRCEVLGFGRLKEPESTKQLGIW